MAVRYLDVPRKFVSRLVGVYPDALVMKDKDGGNPLHYIGCLNYAEGVDALLSAPGAALAAAMRNKDRRLPLHVICQKLDLVVGSGCQLDWKHSSLEYLVLKGLLDLHPEALFEEDSDGETPAMLLKPPVLAGLSTSHSEANDDELFPLPHCEEELKKRTLVVLETLIVADEKFEAANSALSNDTWREEQQSPFAFAHRVIRLSVFLGLPSAFLELLFCERPHLAQERDKWGRVPLHLAGMLPEYMIPNPEEKCGELALEVLIKTWKDAAKVRSKAGHLPLFDYIRYGIFTAAGVELIAKAHPGALMERDRATHLHPFMLAAVAADNEALELVFVSASYELLRMAPNCVTNNA